MRKEGVVWRYIRSHNRGEFKKRRQNLRTYSTKAEYVLWQELRREKIGYRFRRQFGITTFIVDFYCPKLWLIIEVDGPIHIKQKEYDATRENFLRSRGYTVIRFTNDEVIFERERVLEKIKNVCKVLTA